MIVFSLKKIIDFNHFLIVSRQVALYNFWYYKNISLFLSHLLVN